MSYIDEVESVYDPSDLAFFKLDFGKTCFRRKYDKRYFKCKLGADLKLYAEKVKGICYMTFVLPIKGARLLPVLWIDVYLFNRFEAE